MTVMDRFQYDNITKDLSSLVEQGSLSLFPYDFQSRSMSTTKIDLTLKESCIAFIDGVIVLDHPYIRKISSLKLYLEEEETIRKGRFIQFYRSKGLLDQELLALYEQRLIDELPHVYKTREIADYIVKM